MASNQDNLVCPPGCGCSICDKIHSLVGNEFTEGYLRNYNQNTETYTEDSA